MPSINTDTETIENALVAARIALRSTNVIPADAAISDINNALDLLRQDKQSTFSMLVAGERPIISLEDACESMGVTFGAAKTQVAQGKFPLPVFKTSTSKKSQPLLYVADLATYLEERRENARQKQATNT